MKLVLNIDSYYSQENIKFFLIKAIELNDKCAEAYILLGKILIDSDKRISDGIHYFNKAEKIDKNITSERYHFFRNKPFLYQNSLHYYKREELLILMKEYQKLDKEHPHIDFKMQLLELVIFLRKDRIAGRLLEELKKIKIPDNHIYSYNKLNSKYHENRMEYDHALMYLEKLPHREQYDFYYNLEQFSKAKESIEQGIIAGKETKQNRFKIADCLYELGKYKEALFEVEEIVNKSKIGAYVYDTLNVIRAYICKSKIMQAEKKFDQAVQSSREAYYIASVEDISAEPNILKDAIYYYALMNSELELEAIHKIKDKIIKLELDKKNADHLQLLYDYYNTFGAYHSNGGRKAKELAKRLIDGNSYRNKDYATLINPMKSAIDDLDRCYAKAFVDYAGELILDNKEYISRLAHSYNILEMYREASDQYKKLLQSDPQNVIFLNNLGVAYGELSDHSNELKFIEDSLENGFYNYDRITRENNRIRSIEKQLEDELLSRRNRNDLEKKVRELYNQFPNIIINSAYNNLRRHHSRFNFDRNEVHKFKTFNNNCLDSIVNDYFYFSDITQLNDPLDILLPSIIGEKEYKYWDISKKDIKILSLSEVDNHTLMWSHYADDHKGLCISYKLNSLPEDIGWGKVNYENPEYNKDQIFEENGIFEVGVLTKHKTWSYEKEHRLFVYKPDCPKIHYDYPLDPINSDRLLSAYISKITLGYQFPDEFKAILKPIIELKNKERSEFIPPIKIFNADLDPEHHLKLRITEISL